jgi:hypothetical protein
LLVKNAAAFAVRYAGLNPAPRILGVYSGYLNNQGEQVILNNASGGVIRDFIFDDSAPWPDAPDGSGMSLTLIDPLSNPDHALATSWRGSTGTGGSPGTTSFAAWKAANGVVGDNSDTDHDGLTALLEYVLNTDPGRPDSNVALVGTDAMKTYAAKVFYTGSYWGSAVPMAAGVACLKELKRTNAPAYMLKIGKKLCDGLVDCARSHGYTLKVTGEPSMPYLRIVDDESLMLHQDWCGECTKRGAYFTSHHNWFMSCAHTQDDLERTLAIAEDAFAALETSPEGQGVS